MKVSDDDCLQACTMLNVSTNFHLGFEIYLKTKIEKLSQLETDNLDCKSPDFHEQFSTKSFDESKASVYFTPNEGHLSPQPMQFSPIHINYINEGMIGCEAAGFSDEARGPWRSVSLRNVPKSHQRNSFTLPCDYLDENDEPYGNFIVPDPVYADNGFSITCDRFQDVADTPTNSSAISIDRTTDQGARKRKKRYRDHRRSRENETLLMQDILTHDVSKGARPKIYGLHGYGRKSSYDAIGEFYKPNSKKILQPFVLQKTPKTCPAPVPALVS